MRELPHAQVIDDPIGLTKARLFVSALEQSVLPAHRDHQMEASREAGKNVAIGPELWERAREVAGAMGMTPDEFASEAVRKQIARRALLKMRREGDANRRGMSDDKVGDAVSRGCARLAPRATQPLNGPRHG